MIGYVLAPGESPPDAAVAEATASDASSFGQVALPDPDRVIASPNARRLAVELDVDLAGVTGTGPGGRISEDDVRSAAEGDR